MPTSVGEASDGERLRADSAEDTRVAVDYRRGAELETREIGECREAPERAARELPVDAAVARLELAGSGDGERALGRPEISGHTVGLDQDATIGGKMSS